MAAAIGVQTKAGRERDFRTNSPLPFILGLLFTIAFVATLILVVNLVVVLASTARWLWLTIAPSSFHQEDNAKTIAFEQALRR